MNHPSDRMPTSHPCWGKNHTFSFTWNGKRTVVTAVYVKRNPFTGMSIMLIEDTEGIRWWF